MSDEDDFLSEESYEFEFEDDDDDDVIHSEPPDQDSAENKYYYAKSLKEDSLDTASDQLKALVENADPENDVEWIFKAHKQTAKLAFQQGKYEDVLEQIGYLIRILPKLNGNYAEESISKILHRYSSCNDQQFVLRMYDVIVSHLQDSMASGVSGQRLWIRINMNRLRNFLENGPLDECSQLIDAINSKLESMSESTQNSYVLDIIAAEIEYTFKTDMNLSRLSYLHRKASKVSSAITHPRVMGVIRECSATIHFYRKNFETARVEFYECFKNYDEAGSSSKKKVLKYLSLCSLLTENEVNPFESQETQSYASLPEYKNLIKLVSYCENLDLKGFLSTLDTMRATEDPLFNDSIFKSASEHILHNIKVRLLLNLLKAYKTIRFDSVIRKLQLPDEAHLEDLLIKMANSGSCSTIKVDFSNKFIESEERPIDLIPSTLEVSDVQNNLHILSSIGFEGFWPSDSTDATNAMDVDHFPHQEEFVTAVSVKRESSVISSVIFPKKFDPRFPTKTWFPEVVEEWFGYIKNSFPTPVQTSITQKEKVQSEQQEDAANITQSREPERVRQNTPGVSGGYTNEEENSVDKLNTLQRWAKRIERGLKQ
ncbi:hypothetical protein ACI3LY_004559 [Candidozyma auris]|uniref:PCI domain-containing protein n=2 Tax=Candidozyma auris TaxID=498019 RepID=A0A2H0ZD92_CANAR|nr:hypothetical_protein [[Candida] auris]KND99525.2 hypothetical protein QG37_03675 [[Candida] auris]PIS48591.1 hypothetical protein B9J08_005288 [[Candida] auris]PIS49204.1 hypothetical protein CJI97_005372 [[Candida] auris]QEO23182.1 hypothetical_protein [[Candida] auris]QWW24653.1 hypothetical protein CA7LBN_003510 [[Candida] auris]